MATKRPVCIYDGELEELRTADSVPGGGGGGSSIAQVEIDFGSVPVRAKTFTITDAGVSATSKIMALHSGAAATGRVADENEMDALICRAGPGAGQFTLYVDCLTGHVSGKYKIDYLVTT